MPKFQFNLPTPVEAAITDADIAEAERINNLGGDITAQQVANNRAINQGLSAPFKVIEIEGPPGSTREQAERIFQQQNALGQLKELPVGSSVSQALGKVTSSLPKVGPSLSGLPPLPDASKLGLGDFAKQLQAKSSLPGLDIDQVTGLLAQTSKLSGQAADKVAADGSLGKYGISPAQLEKAGLLKPGTVQRFGQDPSQLTAMLQSPKVWTGKNGAASLNSILTDTKIQDLAQQDLFGDTLADLRKNGLITGQESATDLASLVSVGAKFGSNVAGDLLKGAVPGNIAESVQNLAKGGQFSVDAVQQKIPAAMKGTQAPQAVVGTVNRQSLDTAMAGILPSGKIPVPNYGGGNGNPVDQNLYANTADKDLTYSGDDEVVRDRINQERQRRGLAPLSPPLTT